MRATRSFSIWVVVGLLALLFCGDLLPGQQAPKADISRIKSSMGQLPLYFVENRDVYPDEVKFYVQGAHKTLFFTNDGITFRLKGQDRGWVVKLDFVGANEVQPEGQSKQEAVFSYFKGSEKDWKAGLPSFSKVVYRDLWPGIDLVYTGTVNRLKYEFQVAPGADPAKIQLRYRGASSVATTGSGALRVSTPEGSFEDAPPMAWQEVDGKRVLVEMSFQLDSKGAGDESSFSFDLGDYDRTMPLVLDPAVLVYCGYIGGSGDEWSTSIAVDAAGNAYVTGYTASSEQSFPVAIGPDPTLNGGTDAFVAKVNALGTALLYCGYIGGAAQDSGRSIEVDGSGNAYVTGYTGSNEQTFPVVVGPGLTYSGGTCDAFVAKVNAAGTALVYCGYIGGAANDYGYGIAVDATGNAYVTGGTSSDEKSFPVVVGPDLTYKGAGDAFVSKVNAAGTALLYCGYISGSRYDGGKSIAVDAAGNAYVVGQTASTEQMFPVTVGPDLTYNGGTYDAFVAKVNASGTALVYCGYIGGASFDFGYGIAVDVVGNAYVAGQTASTEQTFPVAVGPDLTHNGGRDVYVAKVNAAGTGLVYCGYIGGSANDYAGNTIAVDAAGNAYVTGYPLSTEQTFPVAVGPDLTYKGGGDAFVAKVNAQGTGLVYCGYIGGSQDDYGFGIAVDAVGNAYIAGVTNSNEQTFPVGVGPGLTYNGGRYDAFVAKVSLTMLGGSGAACPGTTVTLMLNATDDAGISYQIGSSLGTGPIPIDTRQIGLSPDNLLFVTVNNYSPAIFSCYRGVIGSNGQAQAAIHLPNVLALKGVRLHTAFVTVSPSALSGIKSISNTYTFTVR
jgi:beta-propeller repeat-containing protein